ncbi:MAG: hypothetical protein KAJ14_13635, partial [Candidatus Omnitrophica bacterium]|nr:hypothetical protein [Candidatus Omnitrophota bacterium]
LRLRNLLKKKIGEIKKDSPRSKKCSDVTTYSLRSVRRRDAIKIKKAKTNSHTKAQRSQSD